MLQSCGVGPLVFIMLSSVLFYNLEIRSYLVNAYIKTKG